MYWLGKDGIDNRGSVATSHEPNGARKGTICGRIILYHTSRSSRLAYGSASQLQLADRLSSNSTQFTPILGYNCSGELLYQAATRIRM
jgi:hypothetical protein